MKRSYFICNVFDEATKFERGITSDSPAASKKVFSLSRSLVANNVRSIVVSLGRGTTSNTGKFFKAKVTRMNSIPIIFLPFWDVFFLSNMLTVLTLPFFILRLNKKKINKAYIFYNRLPYYLPALFVTFFLRCRIFLDLEDGNITSTKLGLLGRFQNFLLIRTFDFFCKSGVILSCSALKSETKISNKMNSYGIIEQYSSKNVDFNASKLRIMFGGSVSPDTGSELLYSVIKFLRGQKDKWVNQINFVITGKGSIDKFLEFEGNDIHPKVHVLGFLSKENYKKTLKTVHVGLALKPIGGAFANTTFPSKVIEYASNRKLVLTTNISDIEDVLSDGAIYLKTNTVEEFVGKLKWIVKNRSQAESIAQKGFDLVNEKCTEEECGLQLKTFLFEMYK